MGEPLLDQVVRLRAEMKGVVETVSRFDEDLRGIEEAIRANPVLSPHEQKIIQVMREGQPGQPHSSGAGAGGKDEGGGGSSPVGKGGSPQIKPSRPLKKQPQKRPRSPSPDHSRDILDALSIEEMKAELKTYGVDGRSFGINRATTDAERRQILEDKLKKIWADGKIVPAIHQRTRC